MDKTKDKMDVVKPAWLKVADACRYSSLGRSVMFELLNKGVLSRKVGKVRLINVASLDAFIMKGGQS